MKLQRVWSSANPAQLRSGVALGVLRNDEAQIFFTTLETDPIPAGTYTCRLLPHPIHGLCWEICDVPNRTGILFHVGNTAADSEGCVLLGLGFALAGGQVITQSLDANNRFRALLGSGTSFTLTIADPVA